MSVALLSSVRLGCSALLIALWTSKLISFSISEVTNRRIGHSSRDAVHGCEYSAVLPERFATRFREGLYFIA